MNTAKLRSKRVILTTITAVTAVAAIAVGGVMWTSAANADVQGGERDRVAAAAVQAVGAGSAVDVETSDDIGEAYEVEVRKEDGSEVDVALDKDLKVVTQNAGTATEAGDRGSDCSPCDMGATHASAVCRTGHGRSDINDGFGGEACD